MSFDLIVSQGRVADRTGGAIRGAELTATAIADCLNLEPSFFGRPSPPVVDDWSESLPAAAAVLSQVRAAVEDSLSSQRTPIVVANTCSVSLATLPAVANHVSDAMVLWVDAHGDFNTPDTTASGYLGGMVLAAACGLWDSGHGAGLNPKNVVVVGGRDIDHAEAELIEQEGVRVLRPSDASPSAIAEIIGTRRVWVHVDWDVLEPGHIPAAYAVPNGFLPAQISEMLSAIPRFQLIGLEIAEFEATGDALRDAVIADQILSTVRPLLA